MGKQSKTLIWSAAALIAVMALSSSTGRAQASISTEGVSRQIMALKAVLDGHSQTTRAALSKLDADVDALQQDSQRVRSCRDRTRHPSLYMPKHARADRSGCVRFSELSPADSAQGLVCSGQTLIGRRHSCSDCSKAGGVPHDMGGGRFICRFARSKCPKGFRPYERYSATASSTCGHAWRGIPVDYANNNCTTGAHAFSNRGAEQCYYARSNTRDDYENAICTAKVVQIGCH